MTDTLAPRRRPRSALSVLVQTATNRRLDTVGIEATVTQQLRRLAVFGKDIGQAQVEHRHRDTLGQQQFVDATAGASGHHVFFQGDQQVVAAGGL